MMNESRQNNEDIRNDCVEECSALNQEQECCCSVVADPCGLVIDDPNGCFTECCCY